MRYMQRLDMQAIALAHPCLLAEETAHPRFAYQLRGGCSLVLSVNAGYE
jgi:hypothetical protein